MRVIKTKAVFWQGQLIRDHFILEHNGVIDSLLPLSEMDWARSLAKEVLEFPEDSVAMAGFHDHHTHTYQRGISLVYPNLSAATSLEQASEIIKQHLDFPARPVIFLDYDDSQWDEPPTRPWLDTLAPDTPVILRRVCGHKAVANSRALDLLRHRGQVSNEETGELLEDIALSLFSVFPPDDQLSLEACQAGQKEALELGITRIREMGDPHTFAAWNRLKSAGLLRLKVEFYFLHTSLDKLLSLGIRGGLGNDLEISGIKVFADGSIGARTARFSKKYHDVNTKGLFTIEAQQLREIGLKARQNGFKLAVHAIGDEAIDMVLNTLIKAGLEGPDISIEHLEAASKKQIKKAVKAGFTLSVQPNFLQWQGHDGMYHRALGPKRAKSLNPFKDMFELGGKVVFGSDSMPPGPIYGMSLAVNHPQASQSIRPEQAVLAYGGSLGPGMAGRIVITNGFPGDKVIGVITP